MILAEDPCFLRCLIVLLKTALFGACDNIKVNKNCTKKLRKEEEEEDEEEEDEVDEKLEKTKKKKK